MSVHMPKNADIQGLLRSLRAHYKKEARSHLPWRPTSFKASRGKPLDPYTILVSEVMLQQTQVDRVIPYFERWIKKFPTPQVLAKAKLSDVLKMWQGLGYNRRGKYLWEAAKIISKDGWGGKLPGVGPYTAAAVQAFAHNEPTVFIETNIRTVFFHHLSQSNVLQNDKTMSDQELLPWVEEALKKSGMEPREFYAALMDYGSHLKKQGIKLNAKSKHYKKQTPFEGSARQKRAAKLRKLLSRGASEKEINAALDA
jgi:A/G-specific adenine glycosylase